MVALHELPARNILHVHLLTTRAQPPTWSYTRWNPFHGRNLHILDVAMTRLVDLQDATPSPRDDGLPCATRVCSPYSVVVVTVNVHVSGFLVLVAISRVPVYYHGRGAASPMTVPWGTDDGGAVAGGVGSCGAGPAGLAATCTAAATAIAAATTITAATAAAAAVAALAAVTAVTAVVATAAAATPMMTVVMSPMTVMMMTMMMTVSGTWE